jgi:hypothetical protein
MPEKMLSVFVMIYLLGKWKKNICRFLYLPLFFQFLAHLNQRLIWAHLVSVVCRRPLTYHNFFFLFSRTTEQNCHKNCYMQILWHVSASVSSQRISVVIDRCHTSLGIKKRFKRPPPYIQLVIMPARLISGSRGQWISRGNNLLYFIAIKEIGNFQIWSVRI